MKKRFGRYFGIAPQPTPSVYQSEFGNLGQRLQQVLQQRVAQQNRLQIRCAIREGVLLILVEHLLHVEPDAHQIFLVLEQVIRECLPDLMASDPACKVTTDTYPLPIRLYLRVAGYQQPYAFHPFTIKTTPSPVPPQIERITNAGIAFPEPSIPSPLNSATPALKNLPVETRRTTEADLPIKTEDVAKAEPIAPIEQTEQPEQLEVALTPELISNDDSANDESATTLQLKTTILEPDTFEVTIEGESEEDASNEYVIESAIEEAVEESNFEEGNASFIDEYLTEHIIENATENTTEYIAEEYSAQELINSVENTEAWVEIEQEPEIEPAVEIEEIENKPAAVTLEKIAEDSVEDIIAEDIATESITEEDIAEASSPASSIADPLLPESLITEVPIAEPFVEDPINENSIEFEPAESFTEHHGLREIHLSETIEFEPGVFAANIEPLEATNTSLEEHEGVVEADSVASSEFEPVESVAAISLPMPIVVIEESAQLTETLPIPGDEAVAEAVELPSYTIEATEVDLLENDLPEVDLLENDLPEISSPEIESIETEPVQPIASDTVEAEDFFAAVVNEDNVNQDNVNQDTISATTDPELEEQASELPIDTLESPMFEASEMGLPEVSAPETTSTESDLLEFSLFSLPETDLFETEPVHLIQPIASDADAIDTTEVEDNISVSTTNTDTTEAEEISVDLPEIYTELFESPNVDVFLQELTPEIDQKFEEEIIGDPFAAEIEDSINPVENTEILHFTQDSFTEIEPEEETNGHKTDLEILEEFRPTFMTQTTDREIDQPADLYKELLQEEPLDSKVLSNETLSNEAPSNETPSNETPSNVNPIDHRTTPELRTQKPKPIQLSPLLVRPAYDLTADIESSSLDQLPLEVGQKRRSLPSLATIMLSGAVGLFFVVSGAYAVTRPCVLGAECLPLEQARQLSQRALTTIQNNPEALEVVEAHDQLTQAMEQLETIPSWSQHYQTAQTLIAEYSSKAEVLGTVVKALNQANTATRKSLNPPHPVQIWREIQFIWREAISTLETIPADSPVYSLAQSKLKEYQSNLDSINHRIITEQNAQQRLDEVKQAANVTEARSQIVNSMDSWQQTIASWTTLLDQLKRIPQGTSAYTEAQRLFRLYSLKLENAEKQLSQSQLSTSAYNQAANLAEQARRAEQQSNWSQAVLLWRDAITALKQVPEGTTYYSQAQTLLQPYTTSLKQSETNLKRVTLTQTVQPQLDRLCSGIPRTCTFTIATEAMRVQLTPEYDQLVKRVLLSSQLQGNSGITPNVTNQVNQFLQSLGTVSQSAQVPLELYDATGSRFATYDPRRGGYTAQ